MQKVKILFLASNPSATGKLKLDEEIRQITEKIRTSEYRDSLELISWWALRPDDLLLSLNEVKPHIVHFSGHGSDRAELVFTPDDTHESLGNRSESNETTLQDRRDMGSEENELDIMDSEGAIKLVSLAALVNTFSSFKNDKVRLIMLNACHTHAAAEALSQVIDFTIGMNRPIGDDAAIVFAASFYRAIGFGRTVEEAFKQGKSALELAGISEEETPELFHKAEKDPEKTRFIDPTGPEFPPPVIIPTGPQVPPWTRTIMFIRVFFVCSVILLLGYVGWSYWNSVGGGGNQIDVVPKVEDTVRKLREYFDNPLGVPSPRKSRVQGSARLYQAVFRVLPDAHWNKEIVKKAIESFEDQRLYQRYNYEGVEAGSIITRLDRIAELRSKCLREAANKVSKVETKVCFDLPIEARIEEVPDLPAPQICIGSTDLFDELKRSEHFFDTSLREAVP